MHFWTAVWELSMKDVKSASTPLTICLNALKPAWLEQQVLMELVRIRGYGTWAIWAGCHHLPQQPTVTLGAEGKSHSRKTAGFWGFRIDMVVLYFKGWHY